MSERDQREKQIDEDLLALPRELVRLAQEGRIPKKVKLLDLYCDVESSNTLPEQIRLGLRNMGRRLRRN